jgi:hypothetical protein
MNTKIGTSFGLALLMAIAAFATMFALGMFSASQVYADDGTLNDDPDNKVHNVTMTPSTTSVNGAGSWDVTFGVSAALVAGTGTITIQFPAGVVLPETMDKTRVSAGAGTDIVPLTSDPTITTSTRTVILTVPATSTAGGALTDPIGVNDQVTVFFSQLAGIINPAASGAAGAAVVANQGDVFTSAQTTARTIASQTATTFVKTIAIDKTSQVEGGAVEVKLAGFTADLKCTLSGSVSGSGVPGSDKKVTIAGTKKSSGTTVTATCTDAGTITSTATVAVKAELTVTATGKAGDTITLTGKNYTASGNIPTFASVLFSGVALTATQDVTDMTAAVNHVDKDDDGDLDDFAVKVLIPSGASSGVHQVKVTGSTSSATATIDVTGRTVLITPDSGPPGTVLTITGSGFPESVASAAANTSVLTSASGSVLSTTTGLFTNGSGALPGSDQFTIPASAAASTLTLTVSINGPDGIASTGLDKFTVTSRVLEVLPTSGPRGTKVLITGTKFTASGTIAVNVITVDTKATIHSVANLTSSGDVPGISLDIPKDAGIGSKTISAADTAGLVGTVKFTITVPTIEVGLAEAKMGQSVPITGAGWVPSSSVTITLASAGVDVSTKIATADGAGAVDTTMVIPSTVGVGPLTVTFTAADQATYNNTAVAQTMKIPKPIITLSVSEADIGDVVDVTAAGFAPSSGLSTLTIGGADVRSGVVTSDTEGGLTTSFIVPGVTGSNIVTVTIGAETVSTSMSVLAASTTVAATTAPAEIFADVIANDDNLVRVWRFSNAAQDWEFYDPRAAFASANTLEKSGTGDIVWINVVNEQDFQGSSLYGGWNLISLS